MRSSNIIPVNAHQPSDSLWIHGTDSMKNRVMMNAKTAPDFLSSVLSLIGY